MTLSLTCPHGHTRVYRFDAAQLAVLATGVVPASLYCLDCGEQWAPEADAQRELRAWAERAIEQGKA